MVSLSEHRTQLKNPDKTGEQWSNCILPAEWNSNFTMVDDRPTFRATKKKKKKKRRKKRKKASRVFRIIFYPTIVSIATSNMNLSGRQREEEQFGPTVLFRDNFQPLRHRGSPLSFLSSGNVISIFITRTCHAAFSSLDGRQLYPWHPVRRKVLNYFVRTPDGKFTSRCWPFDRPRKFAAFRLIAPSIEPARCAV